MLIEIEEAKEKAHWVFYDSIASLPGPLFGTCSTSFTSFVSFTSFSSFSKDRCSQANFRGAFQNGYFKVVRHAHG